jgi:hypothetical protein
MHADPLKTTKYAWLKWKEIYIFHKLKSPLKGRKNRKSCLFLIMERKRKTLNLETKYDILWGIEKRSKTTTEIAKDFQISKVHPRVLCIND